MHYAFNSSSTAGLLIVEVLFVSAAAIVADLFVPAAGERLLLARILAVALFVGAPPGVFVNQYSFDQTHELDQSSECVGVQKLALVGKCVSNELVVLNVVFGAKTNASRFGCLGRKNLIEKCLYRIFAR